jgi:hypothetical protein
LVLALFVSIAWMFISVFFLVPKSLSRAENIIVFFCLSMIVINIFTIPDLNLRLMQHSYKPELYISYLIQRSIIIPVSLLISINLIFHQLSMFKKIVIAIITLSILCFIELLTILTGIKIYTGWNGCLTIITLTTLITFSFFLSKWIKKFEEV